MRRTDVLHVFYEIRENWKTIKGKGDALPVSVSENGCSEEQLENARKTFAPGLTREEIVLFFDTTLAENGKKGMIFTVTGFYCSDINFLNKKNPLQMPLLYREIRQIDWVRGEPTFTVRFKDGTTKPGNGSIHNHFIALMLNRLAALPEADPETSDEAAALPVREDVIYEAAPEKLAAFSRVSQKAAETVIGGIQEKQSKRREKHRGGVLAKTDGMIANAEMAVHGWYSSAAALQRRRANLRILFVLELLILLLSLAVSGDAADLFSQVFGCTMLGSLMDLLLSLVRRDFRSFAGYGAYMMAGLSCVLLDLFKLELEDHKLRRIKYFVHIVLFTYTSGLALAYLWKGLRLAYDWLGGMRILHIPMLVVGALVGAVLLFLALKELIGNLRDLLLSMVLGMCFAIGAAVIISLVSAPFAALFAQTDPGLIASVRAYLELLSTSLAHPAVDSPELMTALRVTLICGFGVVCAFRRAWNDVKEKREKSARDKKAE